MNNLSPFFLIILWVIQAFTFKLEIIIFPSQPTLSRVRVLNTVKRQTNLEPLASSSFRSSGTNLSFMPHPNSTTHQGSNLSCMPQPNSTVHQHYNRMADAPDHTSIGHLCWSISTSTSNWEPILKPISEMPQIVKVYSSVLLLFLGVSQPTSSISRFI